MQRPGDYAKQNQTPGTNAPQSATPSGQPQTSGGANEDDLLRVQASVDVVHTQDAQALAKALGIDPAKTQEDFVNPSVSTLKELGDLDGSGVPALALKRIPPFRSSTAQPSPGELPAWDLLLLIWDGGRWRVSRISQGYEPFELRAISGLVPASRQIALVVFAGARSTPYPAVYQVKDSAASLMWDGRTDESQYQGYAHGKIEFRETQAGHAPEMVVSGRADPGLLHFPNGSKRGFDVQSVYLWNGTSYAPNKTEYSANEDFKLYEFISALHLHDFRSAYALIDAAKFLKTDAPGLEVFRKHIEASWPEFLEDQIFDAREPGPNVPNDFAFELSSDDKHYVYLPSFSPDPKHLLTGLERREDKGETVSR